MFRKIGAIGMLVVLSAMPAAGQSSPFTFGAWKKLCNDPPAPDCMVINNAYSTGGAIVAEVRLVDNDGTGTKLLRTLLSDDVAQVDAPVNIAIDDASPIPARVHKCFAAMKICHTDLPISAALHAALRSGTTLRIEIAQQRKVSFPFPLKGYAAAVDSKGMTVTEYRQDIERKAEEARKRLEEQARPRR